MSETRGTAGRDLCASLPSTVQGRWGPLASHSGWHFTCLLTLVRSTANAPPPVNGMNSLLVITWLGTPPTRPCAKGSKTGANWILNSCHSTVSPKSQVFVAGGSHQTQKVGQSEETRDDLFSIYRQENSRSTKFHSELGRPWQ